MTDLPVTAALVIPDRELRERFTHSSGPGGQSVNTSDTRVELSWDAGGSAALDERLRSRLIERLGVRLVHGTLTVVGAEHRSQLRNREAARHRLAALIRAGIAPPAAPRRPTRPSRAARTRRIESKRARGQIKKGRARPARDD